MTISAESTSAHDIDIRSFTSANDDPKSHYVQHASTNIKIRSFRLLVNSEGIPNAFAVWDLSVAFVVKSAIKRKPLCLRRMVAKLYSGLLDILN